MDILKWLSSKFPSRAAPGVSADYRSWGNEWQTDLTPTKLQLANHFRGVASACATINSQSVAKAIFHVYSGDTELTDHPLQDLLDSNSMDSRYDLIELTQLYLEYYGEAFWYVPNGVFGIPSEITLLDATKVQKIVVSNKLSHFRYSPAAGGSINYSIEDIVWHRTSALHNPYITVTSPAKQAWNAIKLHSKYESLELSICDNQGRPDMVLVTKLPVGETEQRKLERQYNNKFRRDGNGRIIVMSAAEGEVTPINWPPKDLAAMKVYKSARAIICNNFQIPVPILEDQPSNRAQIEGAFYQYALLAVEPRVKKFANTLTKLARRYDDTLIVTYDPVVSRDEQTDAAVYTSYKTAGILTTDEIRHELGYEPIEGGDKVETSASVQSTEDADADK